MPDFLLIIITILGDSHKLLSQYNYYSIYPQLLAHYFHYVRRLQNKVT